MGITTITTRQRVLVRISAGILLDVLMGRMTPRYYTVTANPLPDDAKCVDARYDSLSDYWELVIESEQLPEVPEAEMLPVWPQIEFMAHYMPQVEG